MNAERANPYRLAKPDERAPAVDKSGEPPDDGSVEHRLTALETRLDTILPTLATKADMESVRADITRWTLATALTIIGTGIAATVAIVTLVKSPAAVSQPQPIVIQLPAQPAPPPPK